HSGLTTIPGLSCLFGPALSVYAHAEDERRCRSKLLRKLRRFHRGDKVESGIRGQPPWTTTTPVRKRGRRRHRRRVPYLERRAVPTRAPRPPPRRPTPRGTSVGSLRRRSIT